MDGARMNPLHTPSRLTVIRGNVMQTHWAETRMTHLSVRFQHAGYLVVHGGGPGVSGYRGTTSGVHLQDPSGRGAPSSETTYTDGTTYKEYVDFIICKFYELQRWIKHRFCLITLKK